MFAVLCLMAVILAKQYVTMGLSSEELLLTLYSDKLFLAIVTIGCVLLVTGGVFSINNTTLLCAVRSKRAEKWCLICLLDIFFTCLLLTICMSAAIVFGGVIVGLPISSSWSEGVSKSVINIADGLDYTGRPFSNLIASGSSPRLSTLCGIVLLWGRCCCLGLLVEIFSFIFRHRFLAIMIMVAFNSMDLFLYNSLNTEVLWFLPCRFSIITAINGMSTGFLTSLIYWLTFSTGLSFVATMLYPMHLEKVVLTKLIDTRADN
jgi:hypothetical protein